MGIYKFNPDDAVRFAREYGYKTRMRGNQLVFDVCPYCKKADKTFAIDLKTGQFNCKRVKCEISGNMLTIRKDFGFQLDNATESYYNTDIHWRKFKRREDPKPKPAAVAYMESRGISEAVTERYEITAKRDNDDIIVFPFTDLDGDIVFVKYRRANYEKGVTPGSKEWCESGMKPILFGMRQCNLDNKTLIITEGQIDSLSVAEAGFENAVSVPTGAKGFTWVPHCWDWLHNFNQLIVFGDYENGKISLLDELASRFNGTVKHVRPEDYLDCKDANDLLRKHGRNAISNAIHNAEIVGSKKIVDLSTVKKQDITKLERFRTGFNTLDRYLMGGLYFGQLVILTGERGRGKSTLASQFGAMCIDAGYPVMFYSGELMDWYFKGWLDRQIAGSDHINTIHNSELGFDEYSVEFEANKRIEEWYKGRAYLYNNQIVKDGGEEDSLIKTIHGAVTQYGCRMIIIDNLMTAITDDVGSDLYRQQSNFVKQLSEYAKNLNVLILLVAHPRKSNGYNFQNDDVAGSSNITNLADVVMRYDLPPNEEDGSRPPEDERDIQIFKNRLAGKNIGRPIRVFFQESSKRITENPYDWSYRFGWEAEQDGFTELSEDEDPVFD